MLDKALLWFIRIWVTLIVLLNLINVFSLFYLHGFLDGWARVSEIYSPYNFINFIVTVISISPAIGAFYLRERLRKRMDT